MPTEPITLTTEDTGCVLDNHRGHYISRDVVLLAIGHGFIVGLCDKWVLDTYDDHNSDENYPAEAVIEMSDEAIEWLNSGQTKCAVCNGTGRCRYPDTANLGSLEVVMRDVICKECSGTGRGDRIAGQNFPPIIPEGFGWGWNDGDFGIYPSVLFAIWDTDGRKVIVSEDDAVPKPQARKLLKENGASDENVDKLLDQWADDLALEVGGFTVMAIANDN